MASSLLHSRTTGHAAGAGDRSSHCSFRSLRNGSSSLRVVARSGDRAGLLLCRNRGGLCLGRLRLDPSGARCRVEPGGDSGQLVAVSVSDIRNTRASLRYTPGMGAGVAGHADTNICPLPRRIVYSSVWLALIPADLVNVLGFYTASHLSSAPTLSL